MDDPKIAILYGRSRDEFARQQKRKTHIFFVFGFVVFLGMGWLVFPKSGNVQVEPTMKPTLESVQYIPSQTPTRTRVRPTAIPVTLTAPLPTATCYWVVVVTANHSINVRVFPGTNREVFRSAKPAEQFAFLGYSSSDKTWVKVGVNQWIAANLVSEPKCL